MVIIAAAIVAIVIALVIAPPSQVTKGIVIVTLYHPLPTVGQRGD